LNYSANSRVLEIVLSFIHADTPRVLTKPLQEMRSECDTKKIKYELNSSVRKKAVISHKTYLHPSL